MAEVVGWRIVKQKHASAAFSGDGARRYGGRWNSMGVAVVYCSEHLSLAALEILVHTQPGLLRDKFVAFRISWTDKEMETIELASLPKRWDAYPATEAGRRLGDEWLQAGRSPVLSLPSVIIPLERTFLLNPNHSSFAKLKRERVPNFVLDPRLHR